MALDELTLNTPDSREYFKYMTENNWYYTLDLQNGVVAKVFYDEGTTYVTVTGKDIGPFTCKGLVSPQDLAMDLQRDLESVN